MASESAGARATLPSLTLPVREWERIAAAAVGRFPEEACGVLLGAAPPADAGPASGALEAVECENAAPDRRRRYEISPRELFDLHRRCRAEEKAILGYWHSHPTGSSRPSDDDREHAFPGVSFLIVPVDDADGVPEAGRPRSWRLDPDRRDFDEERVEIRSSDGEIHSGS